MNYLRLNRPIRVLSLGAGVQSSTIALMAAHGEIDMPDFAIFADTQSEPKSVYRWLDWLKKKLPFSVYRVTKGDLPVDALIVHVSKDGNNYQKSSPPLWIRDKNGKRGLMLRQCTYDYKINPIVSKLREMGGKREGVEQLIGISLDEVYRMKTSKESWIKNRWILIERGMSRNDCIVWMKKNGYPEPPRSSCYLCPYHSDKEWKRLKTDEPETFSKAIRWELDFQLTMSQVKGFRGTPYLHKSCVPLSDIDFNITSTQIDMFENECEGICGV